jgi:DNA-binding CsgD family transcriptional regulator
MDRGFSEVVQRALDMWAQTDADSVDDLRADTERYRYLIDIPKMNLMSVDMSKDDPYQFGLQVPIESADQMRDGAERFGDYPDKDYMRNSVVGSYVEARDNRHPTIQTISTRMRYIFVVYDRIILPNKTKKNRSEWAVGISLPRIILPLTDARPSLSDRERDILDLLILGKATKEIGGVLGLSTKAVEHRLADLRKKYGAKNLVHLATLAASDALTR